MSTERIEALAADIETLRTEIIELSEVEELTDEQSERYEQAIAEWDTKTSEHAKLIDRAEKLDTVRSHVLAGHTISGDGTRVAPVPGAKDRNIYDVWEARQASDSPDAFRAELISRAETAAEKLPDYTDDRVKEAVDQFVRGRLTPGEVIYGDHDSTYAARHVLGTSSPEYRKSFFDYLRGDSSGVGYMQRTTMGLTVGNGGYLLPTELDPTINLINDGTTNPFRGISRIVQTTQKTWYGVTSAGVTAQFHTESAVAADNSPTFGQASVAAHRADAYLQASFELIQDSDISSQVGMLIQDAKNRLESGKFATGTGTDEPYGVVTRVAAAASAVVTGTSLATAGVYSTGNLVYQDVFKVDNALAPRYRPGAAWLANKAIYNTLRQAANVASGTAPGAFWTDFGGGVPSQLIGYPVYESSEMDSTIVSGSDDSVLLLGNFREGFIIADRIGMSIAYNPMVINGTTGRPIGNAGWFAMWRVGSDVVDSTNAAHFKLLKL